VVQIAQPNHPPEQTIEDTDDSQRIVTAPLEQTGPPEVREGGLPYSILKYRNIKFIFKFNFIEKSINIYHTEEVNYENIFYNLTITNWSLPLSLHASILMRFLEEPILTTL